MKSKIEKTLDLDRIDTDIFVGPIVKSNFIRTFGGQIAAQTLVAATQTVDSDHTVHSLHGYFIRPGKAELQTVFLVERIRDGRSFVSRQVKAVQEGKPIFIMQASFHRRGDSGIEHADRMRTVPFADELPEGPLESMNDTYRALLEEWSDWDIRVVPPERYQHNPYTPSQQVVWFRAKDKLPDDETFHICTLTYMSDMTLLQSALVPHPHVDVQEASLDHAMWFLRPFRADEWLLYDQVSPSAANGRALTQGKIFDSAGNLVAIATQEGLTRFLKDGTSPVPMTNLKG